MVTPVTVRNLFTWIICEADGAVTVRRAKSGSGGKTNLKANERKVARQIISVAVCKVLTCCCKAHKIEWTRGHTGKRRMREQRKVRYL